MAEGSALTTDERTVATSYDPAIEAGVAEVYEQAPCGYLATTVDGTIISVNDQFLLWTGYGRDDLIGRRTFADLLSMGGRIYHETHYAPMLRMQGTVRQIALDLVRADGGRLPVLVNSVLGRDATGTGVVVRTAVFDATERREYERELLRAKERAEESERRAKLLVRTLQQTLIPPAPPDIPGLEVAALYRPAGDGTEVGGDFYDVFQVGPRDWIVTVGDVTGKGVDAAAVTALARFTIRGAAIQGPQPRQIIQRLNEALLRDEPGRLCTVAAVRLRWADRSWTVDACAGGHPLPLLVRAGGEPMPLGRPGSIIGAFDTVTLHESEDSLQAGDALVLYTDGVTEGRRGSTFFGEDRLSASISTHSGSAQALAAGVLEDVVDFQDGSPRDDIVVIAVRVPLTCADDPGSGLVTT